MHRFWLWVIVAAFCSLGCSFREPSLQSSDPALKVPAIKAAVQEDGPTVEKSLVGDLDNDDPAIRFYAINALERMTGQRLGYEYYYTRSQRQEALRQWQAWLDGRETAGSTTQPASRPVESALPESS